MTLDFVNRSPHFASGAWFLRADSVLLIAYFQKQQYETSTPMKALRTLVLISLLWAGGGPSVQGATADDEKALYYAVRSQVTVYFAPDSTRPYLRLDFQEPVYKLAQSGSWCRVRTTDGAKGYVACSGISNIWIRVSKRRRRLYLYRGAQLVKTVKADFGYNLFADKERRGGQRLRDHWRTPEGKFYVVSKNPHSKFYKALVLNYPTPEDAERGLKQGLISAEEHEAIVRAHERRTMPPMDTELGGWIEIHGDGTGVGTSWTQGCVAIRNDDMDELWQWVQVGTPVLIE